MFRRSTNGSSNRYKSFARNLTRHLTRRHAYAGLVFDEQHTPERVPEYEVTCEILGRYLGKVLAAARAATDPADRDRQDAE
jgi:hypothetical protein